MLTLFYSLVALVALVVGVEVTLANAVAAYLKANH
jgi:predicted lysophospholipase L1 biosynthesis ABC-type transport system permease subunit